MPVAAIDRLPSFTTTSYLAEQVMIDWILFVSIWTAGQPANAKPQVIQVPYGTQTECQGGAVYYKEAMLRSNPNGRVTVTCFETQVLKDAIDSNPDHKKATLRSGWARTPEQRDKAAPPLKRTTPPRP
jgi:hypothetical protein